MRDEVFNQPRAQIVDFAFNQDVVDVFPDMIRRSVPGYELAVPMAGLMAARHLGNAGRAADLGCSLGATSLAITQQNSSPDIRIVAVDNSAAMIQQARANIDDARIEFVEQDVRDTNVEGCRVVVMNLLLQFLPPEQRQPLLTRLASEMAPSGMLIMLEKVSHPDPQLHQYYDDTHIAWKRANGYSDLEVSQKRSALENVMRIDSEQDHVERFANAGFHHITQWFRCLNWAAFVAYA